MTKTTNTQEYLKVSCTNCGALPGERCFSETPSGICLERVKRSLLSRIPEEKPKQQ